MGQGRCRQWVGVTVLQRRGPCCLARRSARRGCKSVLRPRGVRPRPLARGQARCKQVWRCNNDLSLHRPCPKSCGQGRGPRAWAVRNVSVGKLLSFVVKTFVRRQRQRDQQVVPAWRRALPGVVSIGPACQDPPAAKPRPATQRLCHTAACYDLCADTTARSPTCSQLLLTSARLTIPPPPTAQPRPRPSAVPCVCNHHPTASKPPTTNRPTAAHLIQARCVSSVSVLAAISWQLSFSNSCSISSNQHRSTVPLTLSNPCKLAVT